MDKEDKFNCGSCPLVQIEKLKRRSFRQRHPVLFWGGLILLFVISLSFLRQGESDLWQSGDRLALIQVRGTILDITPTLAWIRKIEHNAQVKGVLLRVDSPGGGVAASQELYTALARLAQKKPLVVSMGTVAASGGLMVSMAGEYIFANPSTVTGSIGVRMDIPQLQGLLDKVGVSRETLVTAPYKDAGSILRPLSTEEREYFSAVLKDMHEQFIEIIAQRRHLSYENAQMLANGKIMTGREAYKVGLVDALGGQEEAHSWLAKKTGLPLTKSLLQLKEDAHWYKAFLSMLSLFYEPNFRFSF